MECDLILTVIRDDAQGQGSIAIVHRQHNKNNNKLHITHYTEHGVVMLLVAITYM